MKARTVLLAAVGVAALVAISLAVKPEDEFGRLRARFRPVISIDGEGSTTYKFDPHVTPMALRDSLGSSEWFETTGSDYMCIMILPNGRDVTLRCSTKQTECRMFLFPDRRPWYVRAWGSIKRRLGL